MTMDIPPYISVSILNNPSFTCTTTKSEPNDQKSKDTPSITILPKKRSFDVAFLISSDDDRPKHTGSDSNDSQQSHTDSIRSAFRKVGFTKYQNSRTPSPIDPIRTPSPEVATKIVNRDTFQNFVFPPRFRENVALQRNFLPTPIFASNPMIPMVTASLLPPSLAALSLPAQNVCAKCNVSFRMTSDLVYHMRSHHKNDHTSPEQLRRRRELEKLKCPVCNESFRERHHLTRHMTAHQDKAGDDLERPESSERCRMKYCPSPNDYRQ